MSNLVETIAEVLSKKFAGKEALREIGERLKVLQERLLSPEQLEVFARLAKHVDEIDPPPPVPVIDGTALGDLISGSFSTATEVIFTSDSDGAVSSKDFSKNKDGSVIGWLDGTTLKIAPKTKGSKLEIANAKSLFVGCRNLKTIDFENAVFTSNDYTSMCQRLTNLQTVKNLIPTEPFIAKSMFANCSRLKTIEGWTEETFALMTNNNATFSGASLYDPDVKTFDFSRAGGIDGTFDESGITGDIVIKGNYESNLNLSFYYITSALNSITFDGSIGSGAQCKLSFNTLSGVSTIDLSKFDPVKANVSTLDVLFTGCMALSHIYAPGNWTAIKNTLYGTVSGIRDVFGSCFSLSQFDDGNISGEYCKQTSEGGYFETK